MEIKESHTQRGFAIIQFEDCYDVPCSIQKSSLCSEEAILFGIDDPHPRVLASQAHMVGVETKESCGWVNYPIPEQVLISTRMHLTQSQVQALLPILLHFADTGELPNA